MTTGEFPSGDEFCVAGGSIFADVFGADGEVVDAEDEAAGAGAEGGKVTGAASDLLEVAVASVVFAGGGSTMTTGVTAFGA
jgi:hypothetical protein